MNTRGKALGRLAILLVVLAVAALAVAGVFGSRMNKKDSAGFHSIIFINKPLSACL